MHISKPYTVSINVVFERWKLANDERKSIDWICRNWKILNQADQLRWSQVQPLLLHADAKRALSVAVAHTTEPSAGVAYCRQRLEWSVWQSSLTGKLHLQLHLLFSNSAGTRCYGCVVVEYFDYHHFVVAAL